METIVAEAINIVLKADRHRAIKTNGRLSAAVEPLQ
jgi:hypothetical protein